MASIQRVNVRGYTYWRIVESRRVNGKPRPFVLAHLGKADDLLKRLTATDALRLHSRSHGAVAAVYALARELDIAGAIDRHLATSGKRDRRHPVHVPDSQRTPDIHDGLSPGRSLELACVGRICYATSKRGFAGWARTTTLGDLASVNVDKLTSPHFWDQMDQVPVEALASIEREIVGRAIERFGLSVDTVLYDATNFFTFMASTNKRCKLPARGHNKQKRHDLRQLGVALLCTRSEAFPLMHQVYGGQVPDVRSFADALPGIRQRLIELGRSLESLTVVYDKGNVSRSNQKAVGLSGLHYVAALTASSQRALVEEAHPRLESVELTPEESVQAYRTRKRIWEEDRTVVVLISERLRAGQLRGIEQHLASTTQWLDELAAILRRGKQRRDRATLARDIQRRLMGRQFLSHVLHVHLREEDQNLHLNYTVDQAALETLSNNWLGHLVLMTDRHDWSTADIIRTYRGQSQVETVFAHLKNPVHVTLRPQYHWTDQKLHVHVFTCVMAYLLGRLLLLKAQRTIGYAQSMERLIDTLAEIRKVQVFRVVDKKGQRVSVQTEAMNNEQSKLARALQLEG